LVKIKEDGGGLFFCGRIVFLNGKFLEQFRFFQVGLTLFPVIDQAL
jgi:hypothetical protein